MLKLGEIKHSDLFKQGSQVTRIIQCDFFIFAVNSYVILEFVDDIVSGRGQTTKK